MAEAIVPLCNYNWASMMFFCFC